MRFGRYRLEFAFDTDAILPPFKGSTFRGAFGIALKQVVCALKMQECGNCILREQCVYSRIFETLPADEKTTGPSPPHPFVIEPPLIGQTFFPKGAELDFHLILFGAANEYLPYFVYAFQQMGRIGIGKSVAGRRPGFTLLRVMSSSETLFDAQEGSLKKAQVSDLELEETPETAPSETEIIIRIETPLRLKFQNRLHADLPFHVLVRGMLRRISSLNAWFGDGEPDLDYRGLVDRAGSIQTVSSTLRWFDWRRYSNRQDQAMLMGGITGEVSYAGGLAEFAPLIRYCEKVHVGKATTFGLGKIRAG